MTGVRISEQPNNRARILSIDAFRGITFFLMILVNELHGIANISPWLKHMPADANAMSFPDVIFPAFLFIVGMSIPFGLQTRIKRGDTTIQIILHVFMRAFALIIMGLFMVNAEAGFDESKMPISIAIWSLISYLAFSLLWGVYRFENAIWNHLGRLTGIVLLLVLAGIYRGNEESGWMSVQWWGILGLIGWAYLIASLLFQLLGRRIVALSVAIIVCTIYYAICHSDLSKLNSSVTWLLSQDAHAAHTTIVLTGLICSLIFFDTTTAQTTPMRFIKAMSFALALAGAGALLHLYFPMSKIYATPSWCFYSSAICAFSFSFLYFLIDLRRLQSWTSYFEPAAVNPLVCYLIPFVIDAIYRILGWQSPLHWFTGYAGILVCVLYSLFILQIVAALNRINFKLRF